MERRVEQNTLLGNTDISSVPDAGHHWGWRSNVRFELWREAGLLGDVQTVMLKSLFDKSWLQDSSTPWYVLMLAHCHARQLQNIAVERITSPADFQMSSKCNISVANHSSPATHNPNLCSHYWFLCKYQHSFQEPIWIARTLCGTGPSDPRDLFFMAPDKGMIFRSNATAAYQHKALEQSR